MSPPRWSEMNLDSETTLGFALSGGFFATLEDLYRQMDKAYAAAAAAYGFNCTGCIENCCMTRFYHHTHLEYFYLLAGFRMLPGTMKVSIRERVDEYDREMTAYHEADSPFRRMCPLNENGSCLLYVQRPMICRLHGIPHEFIIPGKGRVQGDGCHEFDRRCGGVEGVPLGRTPFYRQLADLEQCFREKTGITGKFKRTVAQMLVSAP